MNTPSRSGIAQPKSKLAVFEHISHKSVEDDYDFNECESTTSDVNALVIDDESEQCLRKKRYPGVVLSKEKLCLKCKWDSCEEQFEEYKLFIEHINNDHAVHMKDRLESGMECMWFNCEYETKHFWHYIKHVTYHGYLTKLMSLGETVAEREKLPDCNLDNNFQIPEDVNDFECQYGDCNMVFITIYDFHEHMRYHVNSNPKTCKKGQFILCEWIGCKVKNTTQWALQKHVRTHTKEKVLACPNCASTFSSVNKFIDHRNRQLPIEMQSYQCSQCTKLFPSERILRDHMRNHINHYKCNMCDMTCPKPSALARHIRFRHLDIRPFKCNLCEHSTISKETFERHLLTHCAEKFMACDECDFRCRSLYGLDRHYQKAHGEEWGQKFECHICKNKFDRGNFLTKHLMKKHGFNWPSGHSKFRYKEDTDGIYRLQTVRYESLEVTQEMLNNPQQENDSSKGPVRYSLMQVPEKENGIFKFELKEDDDQESETTKAEVTEEVENAENSNSYLMIDESGEEKVVYPSQNNVVITVDDVDEKGNIVQSQILESNEIICPAASARSLRSRKPK